MHVDQIVLEGFRCFKDRAVINFGGAMTAFVGANGSGKTAAMQALLRVFGGTSRLRELRRGDFYCPPQAKLDRVPGETRSLAIEIHFAFPELSSNEPGRRAIPALYNQLACTVAGDVKCRIRLEATLLEDGVNGQIDSKVEGITTFDEVIPDDARVSMSSADRSYVQVVYVPASRDAVTQVEALLRGRLWQAIAWSESVKKALVDSGKALNMAFAEEEGIKGLVETIDTRWKEVHSANTDSSMIVRPIDIRFEQFVRDVGFQFEPDEEGGRHQLEELSDGQRSLFHLALTAATIDLEREISLKSKKGFDTSKLLLPALTIVAVEEPENNLSPFYLSRIVDQLHSLSITSNAQALISSHSASVMSRVDPKCVRYFRLESAQKSTVKPILLPEEPGEASKYVREAVMTYPELYFAEFVVLGEGSSEEVVIPRIAHAMGLQLDRSFVAIVPLGGRHVRHLWKLLKSLGIPHATLLDLDSGRHGAGIKRVSDAVEELLANGAKKSDIYGVGSLSAEALARDTPSAPDHEIVVNAWLMHLRQFNVFFSSPLDLDMSMLTAFNKEYAAMADRGPSEVGDAFEAALGKKYLERAPHLELDYPMYRLLFLGRGKPVTHVRALLSISNEQIAQSAPKELRALIQSVADRIGVPLKLIAKRASA